MNFVIYKGKEYHRTSSNNLGDVETVTWFQESNEVLDSDLSNELEIVYEMQIIESIKPELTII